MRYLILFVLNLLLSSIVFAQVVDTGTNPSLSFQIIQAQFFLDNTTIKSATIVMDKRNTYEGLLIDLKPEVVDVFKRITREAMGKSVNMVLNKKVIVSTSMVQSEIGASFIIHGITQADAQTFINLLRENARQPSAL